MDARLLSGGTRWNLMPSGGWKPVAPPWLSSSVRSIHQSTLYWSTPKSCWSTPRSQSEAVCWYSPTPMLLPLRSSGPSIPDSVWIERFACMKRREGNTGSITMSAPLDLAIRYEESDISEISNSQKFSCRQKVSDGSEYVWTISAPSTSVTPSVRDSVRSLRAEIMLNLILLAISNLLAGFGGASGSGMAASGRASKSYGTRCLGGQSRQDGTSP